MLRNACVHFAGRKTTRNDRQPARLWFTASTVLAKSRSDLIVLEYCFLTNLLCVPGKCRHLYVAALPESSSRRFGMRWVSSSSENSVFHSALTCASCSSTARGKAIPCVEGNSLPTGELRQQTCRYHCTSRAMLMLFRNHRVGQSAHRLAAAVQKRNDSIDALLAELDRSLRMSRRVFQDGPETDALSGVVQSRSRLRLVLTLPSLCWPQTRAPPSTPTTGPPSARRYMRLLGGPSSVGRALKCSRPAGRRARRPRVRHLPERVWVRPAPLYLSIYLLLSKPRALPHVRCP